MEAIIYNHNYWIAETNPVDLMYYYEEILEQSGFTILDILEHKFKPVGFTALFLLAESHFAIHTFPEHNKTYCELSSCNKEYFDNFIFGDKFSGEN